MATSAYAPRMGPFWEAEAVCIRAWAPEHRALELVLFKEDGRSVERSLSMEREPEGFFLARIERPPAPFLYKMRVDGEGPFPDPWSRAQPFGVHGPSSLPLPAAQFAWTDRQWRGVRPDELVIYEVHVGTATPEGTFEALIPKLSAIRELGATAIELLPVASFSGGRNWGYDGVSLFAPSQAYGGPEGLKRLIDASHRAGLGVLIDAVYNHFGPDGSYLSVYSKSYFTSEHKTPWGDAINYGGERSAVPRELPLSNAEMWIGEYHADGLRLDATHAIIDDSQPHLLQEIPRRARAAAPDRRVLVMAEDERNDARLIRDEAQGGFGLDGVWADDFHHQMRRAFAGDSEGYFQDYSGSVEDIVDTLREGWYYRGQHSKNLGHPRGTPANDTFPPRLVHCIQNHDQVGNRPFGNRLADDVSPAAFRAMSAVLLISPYTPLIFAGQEWNTRTPFLYFTDHQPELGRLVTEGRRKEFSGFSTFKGEEVPDPQERETFKQSVLDWSERERPEARGVLALYRALLALRAKHPALREHSRGSYLVAGLSETAFVLEQHEGTATPRAALRLVVSIKGELQQELEDGWRLLLHSEESRFGGSPERVKVEERSLRFSGPASVLLERE